MSNPPSLRTAEIIAVGSELLGFDAARHELALHRRPPRRVSGIELRAKAVVGDDRADLAAHVPRGARRAPI